MFEKLQKFDTNFVDQEAESLPSSTQYEQIIVPDFQDPRAVRAFLGRVLGYDNAEAPAEVKNIHTQHDDGAPISI